MADKIDRQVLLAELKARLIEFYSYFLGFYLLSLIIAIFSSAWSSFFCWPAFHLVAIFFTLLFIWALGSWRRFVRKLGVYVILIKGKLQQISSRDWLRIISIAIIMIWAWSRGLGLVDSVVLLYALVSVLFILDSRLAAGAALVLLAACPFLLLGHRDAWAETTAVYAYYFLVITVVTMIRELALDKKKKN